MTWVIFPSSKFFLFISLFLKMWQNFPSKFFSTTSFILFCLINRQHRVLWSRSPDAHLVHVSIHLLWPNGPHLQNFLPFCCDWQCQHIMGNHDKISRSERGGLGSHLESNKIRHQKIFSGTPIDSMLPALGSVLRVPVWSWNWALYHTSSLATSRAISKVQCLHLT